MKDMINTIASQQKNKMEDFEAIHMLQIVYMFVFQSKSKDRHFIWPTD